MLLKGFLHGTIISILMLIAIYADFVYKINDLALQVGINFLVYVPAVIVGYIYRRRIDTSLFDIILTKSGVRLYLYPIAAAILISVVHTYFSFFENGEVKFNTSAPALLGIYLMSFVSYTVKLSFAIMVGSWFKRSKKCCVLCVVNEVSDGF